MSQLLAIMSDADTIMSGRTTNGSCASASVLNTTELLEHILLQLPMRDLLLAQHISHRFQNLITSSIHLQRALYFVAAPAETREGSKVFPVINPLLQRRCTTTSTPCVFSEWRDTPIIFSVDAVCATYSTTSRNTPPVYKASLTLLGFHDNAELALNGVSEQTKCYANGSWRRMFATQPLCAISSYTWCNMPEMEFNTEAPKTIGDIWASEHYRDVGCKTVGGFLEEAEQAWEGQENA